MWDAVMFGESSITTSKMNGKSPRLVAEIMDNSI